jgi:DNA polymerase I-like protein with 3'-5' exonuclease and polymerase domains
MTLEEMKSLPGEEQKKIISHIRDVRKKAKVVTYSSLYGIREKKLARDLNCSVAFAKSLLDAFWKKNWAVQKVAEDCEVKHTGQSMWLKNPVSGFWYQLRAEKDRFSTLNQGTGVYCFDKWVYYVRKLGIKVSMQFHDEIGFYIQEGKEQVGKDHLQKAIQQTNDNLKLNVPLGVDVKLGKSYAEVH